MSDSKQSLLAQIKEISDTLAVKGVTREVLQPIFNEDDADLSLALARAALTIASHDNQQALHLRHCVTAYALYNLCADELSIDVQKITKKAMRERALETSEGALTKVSPAAIDLIFDKSDPHVSHVRWSLAIKLAACGAFKETKTLQETHAQVAINVFDFFKTAIDVVCCDDGDAETA